MTKQDHYATLGVRQNATDDEVTKAFRKLARKHHPDVAKDKTASGIKFQEINEAYEILGDPLKRQDYDKALSTAIVTDLDADAQNVVDEYFEQLKPQQT